MSEFYNKTRRSASIPAKLMREGKWYLLPVYYFMLTSYLAREGVANSGSYQFADHIYANQPRGSFFVGKILDAILLNLKSARSMRARYLHAKKEIRNLLPSIGHDGPIDILSVPSGLAREFFETADELEGIAHPQYHRIRWHGIDLDPHLIDILNAKKDQYRHPMHFIVGDAFDTDIYEGCEHYDMIICTGFTEFLDDERTLCIYKIAYDHLKRNGSFYTSGMTSHRLSDYLLKNLAELYTHYRSEAELRDLACRAGFEHIHTYRDELQTILIGRK